MRLRPRFTLKRSMLAVVVLALLLFVVIGQKPRRIIEPLTSPVAVTGWSSTALHLADGRDLPLPDMVELPLSSAALAEATSRGVEVAPDGRVYCQIRIHYPQCRAPRVVIMHLARVDLSLLLQFVGEGRSAGTPVPDSSEFRWSGRFDLCDWHGGAYLGFRTWCEMVAEKRAAARSG